MINKIAGFYLLLVSAVTGLWLVFDFLVVEEAMVGQVWEILDWFMGLGLLIALVFSVQNSRIVSEHLTRAKCEFLVVVFASILFFSAWIEHLQGRAITPLTWLLVDAIFVVVVGAVGLRLVASSEEHEDGDADA